MNLVFGASGARAGGRGGRAPPSGDVNWRRRGQLRSCERRKVAPSLELHRLVFYSVNTRRGLGEGTATV